jgi:hypothetical protein
MYLNEATKFGWQKSLASIKRGAGAVKRMREAPACLPCFCMKIAAKKRIFSNFRATLPNYVHIFSAAIIKTSTRLGIDNL